MTRKNSSRGKKAVASGQDGEHTFEGMLLPYIPNILDYNDSEYKKLYPGPYPDDWPWAAIRQYPIRNPLNNTGLRVNAKNDFMIFGGKRIHIQVKNQTNGGSTDEKVVAAFEIARYALHDTPYDRFLLVLLGIHWPMRKPGLIQWAREVAAPKMKIDWRIFGGEVGIDVVVGPGELANKLAEYHKKGWL